MKHIPRFFISPDDIAGSSATLREEDLKHLVTVLRLKPKDQVILLDGKNNGYRAELLHIKKEKAHFHILSTEEMVSEPSVHITLAAALLKGERFEWVIQKSVEMGVSAIIPFFSSRTVTHLPPEKVESRLDRWQTIAREAAEQSERGIIPDLHRPLSFQESCSLDAFDLKLICAERETRSLKEVLQRGTKPSRILAMVGPEGGFSPDELHLAQENGFIPISLGKRILRAETASLLVIANILYQID